MATGFQTMIRLHDEVWYMIDSLERLVRLWQRALAQRRFMEIRYGGIRYAVNPQAIIYMRNSWDGD